MNRRITVAAALSTAALLGGAAPALAESGTVVRAVDGDTVRIASSAGTRNVNLLGVKAPTPDDCFGAEARRALAKRLPRGARIRLAADPRRGGRARYVFRGATFVNASLVRAGAARASGVSGLKRASALRSAQRAAANAERGLFGECASPSPAPVQAPAQVAPVAPAAPAGPGAVENADAVRAALLGHTLTDLSSGLQSSSRNDTSFCAGNRAFRSEEFNGSSGFSRNDLPGTWAVFGALRTDDGTLAADVAFTADDGTFEQRVISITIAPDGTVRKPSAKASELRDGASCGAAQPDGVLENDTAAARSEAAALLTAKRVLETGSTTSADFCSATRVVRREGGAVVLDGTWAIEWAASDASGTVATLTLKSGRASRRLLVAVLTDGRAQVQDLGAGTDGKAAALSAAAGC